MSHPFFGEKFTFTQPDGSQFDVLGWGDEHSARFESLDGFLVVKDPMTGFYQYATATDVGLQPTGVRVGMLDPRTLGISRADEASVRASRGASEENIPFDTNVVGGLPRSMTRWQQRREEARVAARIASESGGLMRVPPQRKTVGSYVGLTLLIDFPDERGTISRQEVDSYCNQPGYRGYGNNGSVYDYFYEVSGGKFQFTNIVAPYYTARHRKSYYTNPAIPYGQRASELIQEAIRYLRQQGFDFTQLTADHGGYIYAMSVFYAGRVDNNWSEGLWPHAYRLPSPISVAPGRMLSDYQITNMGNELTLGTFCHENGHMVCDFPDLYDYKNDGHKSFGTGVYCLMSSGANAAPKNPTHVGAYLKYKAGWAKQVTPITAVHNATIRAGENDFYLYRKNSTEYFIIENRSKTGRDQALTDSGLAIWHVDELGNNEHGGMTPAKHYECSLIQADNRFDLEKDVAGGGNSGDAGDLFEAGSNDSFDDTTAPDSKWWSGAPSRLKIANISQSGLSMSFAASVIPAIHPVAPPVAPVAAFARTPGASALARNGGTTTMSKWTFMIYIAGDNDLESFGSIDLAEMQAVGSSSDVQIVAQFDSMAEHVTRRYHLKTNSSLKDDCVQELPEVNMGDPNSLYEFVKWATEHYPAERYALVIWNHGSGWKDDDIYRVARAEGVDPTVVRGLVRTVGKLKVRRALFRPTVATVLNQLARAIAYDDTDMDFLDSVEMRDVLARITDLIGRPLDLLGFDACLMSMLEVFYQVRSGCLVAVGSQELEPGDGWPYHLLLDALVQNPTMAPDELAVAIVDTYMTFYGARTPVPSVTQSAVRMADLQNVATAVSQLGDHFANNLADPTVRLLLTDALRYVQAFYDKDYLDLVDLCELLAENEPTGPTGDAARAVLATLAAGQTPLIASRNSGGTVGRANGMSIYLPGRMPSALYQTLDFATDLLWDNFLTAYYAPRVARPVRQ